MTAQIIPFRYAEARELRTVTIDGEPWFVAGDVAEILDMGNIRPSLALLDDDERGVHTVDTLGGQQSVAVVSEAGLYSLILRSRKTEAKAFKRWITHTVLPEIRKYGAFGVAQHRELPRDFAEALRALASEVEARSLAEVRIAELEPAASAWHVLASAGGDFAIAEAAKMLSRDPAISGGQNRLFDWMQRHGWIFRRNDGRPQAYQGKVDAGLLVERMGRPYLSERTGDYQSPAPTIRVTPKGMDRLYAALGGSEALVAVS